MDALNAKNVDSDSRAAARSAKLRYVSDEQPGFSRKRRGRSFAYYDCDHKLLRDPDHLSRIRSLAIPPAWTQVWICPSASGHMQATGRDQRGRKQYRYHPSWSVHRNQEKFGRMFALHCFESAGGETEVKKLLLQAVKFVAKRLGNTPAVCRKYYVHPGVFAAYSEGKLLERFRFGAAAAEPLVEAGAEETLLVSASVPPDSLRPEEKALLAFLKTCSAA